MYTPLHFQCLMIDFPIAMILIPRVKSKNPERQSETRPRHQLSHKDRLLKRTEAPEFHRLRALSTEATGKLDVLGLDGDTLGVDGAQVGILKQGDEVGLYRLLKSTDGG